MGYKNSYMKILEEANIELETYCKTLFRGLMVLRDLQYVELFVDIGGASAISKRTLEGYGSYGGTSSIRKGRAWVVNRIARQLNVEMDYLMGEKSIENLWFDEDIEIRLMMTGEEELENYYLEQLRQYTRTVMEIERKHCTNSVLSTEEMIKEIARQINDK